MRVNFFGGIHPDKGSQTPVAYHDTKLDKDLSRNLQVLRQAFGNSTDVVFRCIPDGQHPRIVMLYIDGLVDTKTLDKVVLEPLIYQGLPQGIKHVKNAGQMIDEGLIAVSDTRRATHISVILDQVLNASVALLFQGQDEALIANLPGFEQRALEESKWEPSLRGPRDGFTESIRVNTSLIRRKLKSPNLVFEAYTLGDLTKTRVELCYVAGVVKTLILDEVRRRIKQVHLKGVLESGYIEEFLEGVPWSPFPQTQSTDRPDVTVAGLIEGRVVVLTDGSPFTLVVPMTFWTALQAAEDYYTRFLNAFLLRVVRIVLFAVSLTLPSFYVAITTFHPQLLPTNLLISIAMAREEVPFPASIEAFLMEFAFEALREAGLRLPTTIGFMVGIIGVLVIGQAAVEAGIISATMVIVVAATGVASFAIPRYNMGYAFRLLRFPILLMASMFGLIGIGVSLLMILIHLVNLKPFGIPYLYPLPQRKLGGQNDVFFRPPWRSTASTPHQHTSKHFMIRRNPGGKHKS